MTAEHAGSSLDPWCRGSWSAEWSNTSLALQAHVEKFLRKVKKVAHEKELKEAQRVTEVNVGAANRFISHALPDLSKAQKRQLREVRRCSQLRPLQR